MTAANFTSLISLIEDYDLFLFDLWGVILEDEEIYIEALKTVNIISASKKVFFVTNAPRPAITVRDNLRRHGINSVEESDVITSGELALKKIKEYKRSSGKNMPAIYHLGEDRNKDLLDSINHVPVNSIGKADVFLLSLYRDDHENIMEFDMILSEAAAKGITTICSNPDTIIPIKGKNRYCAGYFAEKIEKEGGKVVYTGKPDMTIYEEAFLRANGTAANRILMVGDTLETDILGARNAGIDSALVMTGNALKLHAEQKTLEDKIIAMNQAAAARGIIPNFIVG